MNTDPDPHFSVYFWVDHITTPNWIKRAKQHQCYQCQTSLSQSSPHCHLCGMLYCKPCVSSIHLPQRFNLKGRPFGPYTVCNGCLEQVNTRRLSIISELAQQENSTLTNYADLPIVQHTIDPQAVERGEEIQLGKILTPTRSIESEAYSPQFSLLHSFIGVDINISVKQLYASINGTQTQQHLESISLLQDGEIIPLDKLSRVTIKQLLPAAFIATPQQIEIYNSSNPDYPAPNPTNLGYLSKLRDEKRKADKRAKRATMATQTNLKAISEDTSAGQITTETILEESTTTTTTAKTTTNTNPELNIAQREEIAQRERAETSSDGDAFNPQHRRTERSQSRTTRGDRDASRSRRRDSSQSRPRKEKKEEEEEKIYMAMHTYVNTKPQSTDAKSKVLSFAKGDKLRITNQSNNDWWYALTEDGTQKGWIPAAYVSPIDEALAKIKAKQRSRRSTHMTHH